MDLRIFDERKPDFEITMYSLPSWNDFLGMARHSGAAAGIIETWRRKGRDAALHAAARFGGIVTEWEESKVSESGRISKVKHRKMERFFHEPVRLNITFYRATAARYDVFSPMIKPVVDGFVDAGLLEDDSFRFVPETSITFGGIEERLKPSAQERERRKNIRKTRKSSIPMPSEFVFRFYRL